MSIEVRNPFTGEPLGGYQEIGADELRAVIRRARAAQPAWAALPLAERRRHIDRLRAFLAANADRAAAIISACTGKTRLEAFAFDLTPAVFSNAWYCRHAAKHLRARRLAPGTIFLANKQSTLYRRPRGVIGVISPWNYPLGIPMHEIVPALLAGNSVVFKTAPETLPVGEFIAEAVAAAGIPADVFHHVIVDGPVCGEVMLEAGGVDKLFFTGSVRVGRWLATRAAEHFKPVSLELGGKDPMIVLDDADLDRAAHGAVWAGVQNAGQSCAGVERVYVDRRVYEPFLQELKARVETLRLYGPARADSDLGALTTARQVETVRSQLEEALAQGARIFAQGRIAEPHPQLIAPTVVVDVSHAMRLMREETFGPVLGVMPFDGEDEAVRLANDSIYALTASVWSRDRRRAEAIARRLKAGAVTINDHLMSHGMAETPWGGGGASGGSRGHGEFAFEEVTEPQVIVRDRLDRLARGYWWYPYESSTIEGLKGAIDAAHGSSLARRVHGLWRFLKGALRMLRG